LSAITYTLSGRLGNHLQLWACARTLSLRYGWEFFYKPIIHQEELNLRDSYGNGPSLGSQLLARLTSRRLKLSGHEWDQTGNTTGDVQPEIRCRARTYFDLKWSGIFIRVDEFRPQLISELLGDHRSIIPAESDPLKVGIHIRRGDAAYLLPIEYYVRAINMIRHEIGRNVEVNLFSDGPIDELADILVEATPNLVLFSHHGSPVQDMLKLAGYRTIIASFSWFSYWAAYLSHGARVIMPKEFCYYPFWEPFQ
jgi:hypothetical protein